MDALELARQEESMMCLDYGGGRPTKLKKQMYFYVGDVYMMMTLRVSEGLCHLDPTMMGRST